MKKLEVAVVVGTRPEAVKMAPVVQALSQSKTLRPTLVCTSQHGDLAPQLFRSFNLARFHDLRVMQPAQTLWDLSSRLIARLGRFFVGHPPSAVLVQGDTSTALFGALAAFYHQVPVGHVEAGLRTGNPYRPFPEEMNRRIIASLARWHFAPTKLAVKRLKEEGIPADQVYLTGNTVVDALRWMAPRCAEAPLEPLLGTNYASRRLVLVTCHRRENLGVRMKQVGKALAGLARKHPDVLLLLPAHPNPSVRSALCPPLRGLPNVIICDPLPYDLFLACLHRACFLISDSGGVQEEATALGKPVLVLRDETERPEGIRAGLLKLVGTDPKRILRESSRLLTQSVARQKEGQARGSAVFGDGQAARRIVRILERQLRPVVRPRAGRSRS